MIGKLDQTFRFHETALSLRAQRQQLLASNIANADTPNYKARDVDFSKALQTAIAGSAPPVNGMTRTSVAHLPASGQQAIGGAQVQYRGTIQGSVDGNTVDMDVERNQFTDNALRYEAGITMLSHQIRNLMTAIQGQ
jgi:flagellar basal-body rod protein FlgB